MVTELRLESKLWVVMRNKKKMKNSKRPQASIFLTTFQPKTTSRVPWLYLQWNESNTKHETQNIAKSGNLLLFKTLHNSHTVSISIFFLNMWRPHNINGSNVRFVIIIKYHFGWTGWILNMSPSICHIKLALFWLDALWLSSPMILLMQSLETVTKIEHYRVAALSRI